MTRAYMDQVTLMHSQKHRLRAKLDVKQATTGKSPTQTPEQTIHKKVSSTNNKSSTASSSTDKYDDAVKGVDQDRNILNSDHRSIQKGVIKLESKPLSWWNNKANIAHIKEQAELRGYRFSDIETKGGIAPGSGSMTKQTKFKKSDYLRVLTSLLNKSKEV